MSNATEDQETLRSFIDRMGLTMQVEEVPASERPGAEHWMDGARHFRCEIERRHELSEEKTANRWMLVYFSQGPGVTGEPELPDVLSCIASDIASVEPYDGDKWEWMRDLDMVSEQGEKAWKEIHRQREKLEAMLGADWLEALLYDVRHE